MQSEIMLVMLDVFHSRKALILLETRAQGVICHFEADRPGLQTRLYPKHPKTINNEDFLNS